jgi:TolB-like protein/Flp pilus assembly protein TadD
MMSEKPSFFSELKRRNIVRMAGLYLVGAWLLVQVAGTLLPVFDAPAWVMKTLVGLLAAGLVPALIFSWAFELTPQGLKRDEDVRPEESIAPQTARRMNRMIIAALVLALAYFGFDKIILAPRREAALVAATEKSVAARSSAEPKSAANAKSVAVLAFANLSDDKGSEYFSDGISEELLTVLQKIPGLHVAARTSAFSFKGKNATAQEIGRKLGVARLVEGSVRKAGEIVRIAARLTQADTGEQLWSENYTRDLKDVFAVQTELAQTIVGQLSGQLTDGAVDPAAEAAIQAQVKAAEKGGTKNVEAHQHYLRGRFYANRGSEKGAGEALAEYQRAVELDPSFALAWAGLAQTHVWYCGVSSAIGRAGFDDHLARAREAAARALAIEPNLPEALRARATIQLHLDFDWNGAAETVRSALALAPADPAVVTVAGTLALARGDSTRAIELYRQAVALDPVNPGARAWLAFLLAVTGRFAEARAEYPRVVELLPAAPWSHAGLGFSFLLEGKFEEAAVEAQADAAEWARLLVVAMARWSQKRIPEADAALARLTEGFADVSAYNVAEVYAYRGDKDRAFEWLERARRQRDSGLDFMLCDPFLANLREDPRWDAFLHTMGLADHQLK